MVWGFRNTPIPIHKHYGVADSEFDLSLVPASLQAIANIRKSEYSYVMQNLLREYKASIFHALAHPTRVAIVEALRDGEISARVIQERLGVEQANLSQHLAILRSRQIVANRKEGNQVFYSLRNKALIKVLDMMRRYFQAHLAEEVQMLGEIEAEDPARRKERLD